MKRVMQRGSVLVAMVAGLAFAVPAASWAHCDTLDGPVVTDARTALERGDVTPVLKWVPAADEDEIRAAFDHVMQVRALGDEAQALADRYFFETLVRVHRAAEGAPYTGLKPAGSGGHVAENAADAALEEGSVDALAERVAAHAADGVRARFAAAAAAKAHADESVAAGREYVEAYVTYVHYVLGLHNAIEGVGGEHHAAEPAPAMPSGGHVH